MEIQGKFFCTLPVQTGEGRNGQWKKQDFVIETEGKYPKKAAFTLFGDKIDMIDRRQPGDMLTVKFEIESREYQGKYYTNLSAFSVTSAQTPSAPEEADPLATVEAEPVVAATAIQSDLPF